jgi:hypothetical protein
MRTKVFLFCAVVLAVCLLLLFKATQRQKTVSPIQSETPTNQPSQSEPPKAVENRQTSNTSGISLILSRLTAAINHQLNLLFQKTQSAGLTQCQKTILSNCRRDMRA